MAWRGQQWRGGGDWSPPPRQISPHRCNDKCIGPPKLKFLQRFDQNMEYKRPAGAYPLRDFHKIRSVCTPFQAALAFKTSLDLLMGLRSYRGFKLTGLVIPKFSAPLRGETIRQTPKSFRGARTCSRSFITMPSLMRREFHRRRGGQKR